MGAFAGIPVLLLLVVTLVGGCCFGAVCTLLCEMCVSRRRRAERGHEVCTRGGFWDKWCLLCLLSIVLKLIIC